MNMDGKVNIQEHSLDKASDANGTQDVNSANATQKTGQTGMFGKFKIGPGNGPNSMKNKLLNTKLNMDYKGLGERT
jgi:hypothetical protein